MRRLLLLSVAFLAFACDKSNSSNSEVVTPPDANRTPAAAHSPAGMKPGEVMGGPVEKLTLSDEEWKKRLTPAQYHILREKGTEVPFTGPYHAYHGKTGIFHCAGCDLELFRASEKFDSGTGWPSFFEKVDGHVLVSKDADGERDELSCARCGGHLGHVFSDGPKPTGLRYCIDGYALKLVGGEDEKK